MWRIAGDMPTVLILLASAVAAGDVDTLAEQTDQHRLTKLVVERYSRKPHKRRSQSNDNVDKHRKVAA